MLSREEILRGASLRRETVDIPEWGGPVIVQEQSAYDYTTYQRFMAEGQRKDAKADPAEVYAKMVARGVVSEDGNRVFEDEDYKNLAAGHPFRILEKIADVFLRVHGMEVKQQEAVAKNSEPSPSEDSPSA